MCACCFEREETLARPREADYTLGRMNADYHARLNRVIDYIDSNLAERLDLDTLAGLAAFYRYHFHRVFSAVMGETPGAYIQRLRMEKAAGRVAEENPPITEIAMHLGFSGPSVFSRAFSDYFGVNPNRWRRGEWKDHGKNSKLQSNRCYVACPLPVPFVTETLRRRRKQQRLEHDERDCPTPRRLHPVFETSRRSVYSSAQSAGAEL